MKRYVADTVAIVRYFEDALPPKGDAAFREAEEGNAEIFVPEIVTGEFIYIAMKNRIKTDRTETMSIIREILDEIESSSYLKPIKMSSVSWNCFLESPVLELHDRIIHSIALSLEKTGYEVSIITSDSSLKSVFARTIG